MARTTRGSSKGFPAAVAARARKIRLLLMDVDGVLTGGHVYLLPMPDGTAVEMKAFHSQDGAGLKMALDAGLRTGVITGRESPAMTRRAQEVGMEFVYSGPRREARRLTRRFCAWRACATPKWLTSATICPTCPCCSASGLAIAVANAVAEVRRAAHYVTRRSGGDAGVREAIEGILKAQGKWLYAAKRARA